MSGVTLNWTDNGPGGAGAGSVVSDGSGNYSITVSYDWTGSLTPILTGYSSTPANISFNNVLADITNQDFVLEPILYTISGNAGVWGAVLSYTEGSLKTVAADANGIIHSPYPITGREP